MIKLNNIIENVLPSLGYDLIDMEVTPSKVVRVFIDKADGVNIQDCELVSNHLSRLLLVEEIDYNRLEISSPGLDRPLKKIEDYKKSIGKLVKIKTKAPINNEKVFLGVIDGVEDSLIRIKCNDTDLVVDFDNIAKSRLVFDMKKKPIK